MTKVSDLYSSNADEGSNAPENTGSQEAVENQAPANPQEENAPAEEQTQNNDDWMNTFLESRGVQDGVIEYGDGDNRKFSELDPKDKISILDQLTNQSSEYTEDEKSILNTMREKDIEFNDLIEMEVAERMKAIDNDLSILNSNTEALSNEDAHYAYLRRKDPERTTESIEEEIAMAKDMPSYDDDTAKMKNYLISQEKLEKEEVLRKNKEATFEKDEIQRKKFVNDIVGLNNIGNWIIDEKTKEEMLHDILEYDTKVDNGNTIFVNDLLSSPEKMMKAKFFLDHGEERMRAFDLNKELESKEAYNRGYNAALNGGDNKAFTEVRKKDEAKASDNKDDSNDNKKISVNDLYR